MHQPHDLVHHSGFQTDGAEAGASQAGAGFFVVLTTGLVHGVVVPGAQPGRPRRRSQPVEVGQNDLQMLEVVIPAVRLGPAGQEVVADRGGFGAAPRQLGPLRPQPAGSGHYRAAQSASVIVTDSMVTVSLGVPDLVPMESMAATTSSPLTTLPNNEYWGGRRMPEGPLMTKN